MIVVERRQPATYVALLGMLALAIAARALLFPLTTYDLQHYYGPWLAHVDTVGMGYLRHSFTNYSVFYDHAFAFMSLFPGPLETRVKLFSILFDVVLASVVARIVPRDRAILAFGLTLLLPTVIANSSLLGQTDAIYSAMGILAIALALRDRPVWAMLAFSVAVAVKLQAIIFMPVLILLFLDRRLPLWTFLLAPVAYVAFALPLVLGGRPVAEIVNVYAEQFGRFHTLASNAANPWTLLKGVVPYKAGLIVGLPLAVLITGAAIVALWKSGLARTREGVLLSAAILLMLVPYVTPKMQDRYFFQFDPVLVALVCMNRQYWKPLVLAQIGSLCALVPFVAYQYGADHWLFGLHGYLQQRFHVSYGLFPAAGAVFMGVALFLLIRRARAVSGTSGEQHASLATMVQARLRPVVPLSPIA